MVGDRIFCEICFEDWRVGIGSIGIFSEGVHSEFSVIEIYRTIVLLSEEYIVVVIPIMPEWSVIGCLRTVSNGEFIWKSITWNMEEDIVVDRFPSCESDGISGVSRVYVLHRRCNLGPHGFRRSV